MIKLLGLSTAVLFGVSLALFGAWQNAEEKLKRQSASTQAVVLPTDATSYVVAAYSGGEIEAVCDVVAGNLIYRWGSYIKVVPGGCPKK
jgi:hypothetical protein